MGQSVGSRFVLGDLVGRGAMGRVHRGTARDDGHEVAIKLLRDDLADQPDIVSRFVQERRLLRTVSHPNVVRVHDLIVDGDVLAIVMDLVSDGDLTRLGPTPLEPVRAVTVLAEVADGLAAVHRAGVIHCDLKPANVLVHLREDGSAQPKLTDFGVSRLLSGTVTATQTVFGSPGYLAPEVASGRRPTPAADVYALGVMLYDFLTGRHPFVAEHPIALLRAHAMDPVPVPAGLPAEVLELVLAMLSKTPAERPAAAEVADRLRELKPLLAGAGPFEVPEPSEEGEPAPPSTVVTDGPTMVGAPPVNLVSPVNGLPPLKPGNPVRPSPVNTPRTAVAAVAAPTGLASGFAPGYPAALATPPRGFATGPGTPARGYAQRGGPGNAPATPPGGFDDRLLGLRSDGPPHVPGYPQQSTPPPPEQPRSSRFRKIPQPYLVGALTLVVLLIVSLAVTLYPRENKAAASTSPGDLSITETTPPSGGATTAANVPGTTAPAPTVVSRPIRNATGSPRVPVNAPVSDPAATGPAETTTKPAAAPKVSDQTLPDATLGQSYTTTLKAKGTGDLSWTTAGGSLPEGLSLTGDGAVTGTPASTGSSSFSVRVTDASGRSDTADVSISVSRRTGDLDGNGAVDCADLAILQSDYGTSASRSDLNNDGVVDDQDAAKLISLLDSGTC